LAGQLAAQTVTQIAAGSVFSLFVKSDGSLWGMGDNEYGELGLGPVLLATNVPQEIVTSGVGMVAVGYFHSLFTQGNALWAMGDNEFGQLGDGTTNNHYVPEQIISSPQYRVTGIAAGGFHSLFTTFTPGSGRFSLPTYALWAVGQNDEGELGDGTNNQYDAWFPIGVSNVVAIAAGEEHSLFIKSDGSLWGMGDNYAGQLGPEPYPGPYYLQYNVPVEIVPPPQPVITGISVAGSNVVVTWPTNQGGFSLQSTTNVGLPAAWSAVSPGPVIVNGQFTVTNPISASQQFYRLSE
jgi:hypothetical protein